MLLDRIKGVAMYGAWFYGMLRRRLPSLNRPYCQRTVFTTHHGIPGGNPDQVQTHRKWVNVAVGRLRLKRQHERDRMTLSLPTAKLASWLVAKELDLPFVTCVGTVVAVKHFAGSQSPRQKITKQAAVERPAPPGLGPQELSEIRFGGVCFCGECGARPNQSCNN